MGDLKKLEPRTGKTQAKKAAAKQQELMEKQRQKEMADIAESEDVIARKRLMGVGGRAGRRSLIKTSEQGVKSTNLGGTV